MDSVRPIDIKRMRQLNSPGYVRTRLGVIYILIFALAAVAGVLLSGLAAATLPAERADALRRLFLVSPAGESDYRLIYEIIYNSVDIFKISFIILLAGFTYIASFVNRAMLLVAGLFYGICGAICVDGLLGDYYGGGSVILLINLTLLRFLMLASVIIFSAVTSEYHADLWGRYRSVAVLLRSWEFWRYIVKFLMFFGYVILNDTAFRFLLKIIV